MEPHQLSNNHAVYVDSYGHILYVEIGKPSFVCKNIYPEGWNIEYTMLHTCELIRKKEQNITKYDEISCVLKSLQIKINTVHM